MDRIDLIRAFVTVVDRGSFTAAAGQLRLSAKLVGKYVAALEANLGQSLLHRTTRAMSLTDAGERYLPLARRALTAFDELEAMQQVASGELTGALRVTAPTTFGELFITRLTHDFLMHHPRLSMDVVLTDRFVNLSAEAFDVAIRIGNLGDSSMKSRRLGETSGWVLASPEYLARHKALTHPSELSDHLCIHDSNGAALNRATFVIDGKLQTVALQSRIAVNSAAAACRLAVAGEGIAIVPRFAAEADVAAGRLQRLLTEYDAGSIGIQALYLRQPFPQPRIAAYLVHLQRAFRRNVTPEPPPGS